jgi:hypothetical protein
MMANEKQPRQEVIEMTAEELWQMKRAAQARDMSDKRGAPEQRLLIRPGQLRGAKVDWSSSQKPRKPKKSPSKGPHDPAAEGTGCASK